MKLLVLGGVLVFAGCAELDGSDEPDESVVDSESVPTANQGVAGQGTSMQGTSMQGTSMQGTSMQGTSMQGTSMQGSYGGGAVSYASVSGTALIFWKRVGKTWQQRFPDKICYWNATRRVRSSCTTYDLRTQQSPLVGSTWPTTFTRTDANGGTTTIPVTLAITAVRTDTSSAMFPLTGAGATGALVNCENPKRCRRNTDLFLYDVTAIDVTDANGAPVALCPSGHSAFALAGTWDARGNYTPSTTKFMFGCTNGTIAKCTRWGYRPWARAIKTGETTTTPLADYHAACIRAAAADYCALGHSFTKDGTLVDVYDFVSSQTGFIPKLRGFVLPYTTATAFVWEAQFDRLGAWRIDHARYAELAATMGSIESVCPGVFQTDPSDDVASPYTRWANLTGPSVYIDSTPACSHAELTVGKWLHPACSDCTGHAPAHCTDPAGTGWDQSCVDFVAASSQYSYQVCYGSTAKGAAHSECSVGVGLGLYDTGCTLSVCLDPAYASCCSVNGWTSSCVTAANSRCRGGREGRGRGFCGTFAASPIGGSTF